MIKEDQNRLQSRLSGGKCYGVRYSKGALGGVQF